MQTTTIKATTITVREPLCEVQADTNYRNANYQTTQSNPEQQNFNKLPAGNLPRAEKSRNTHPNILTNHMYHRPGVMWR